MERSPKLTAELVRLVATRGKRARISITGASMEPSLRAGMVVDIEPLNVKPCIGDILVFRSQRSLIAHRVIGVELRARSETRAVDGDVDVDGDGPDAGEIDENEDNNEDGKPPVDEPVERYITCGDAHPDRTERVPPHSIVGRVCAVWTSAEADATRVDDRRFERQGVWCARTRRLRASFPKLRFLSRLLAMRRSSDPARTVSRSVFGTLVTATRAFERGDYALGVTLIDSLARTKLIETARRHHLSGCISDWFEDATRAAVAVPSDLAEVFRRLRWANAIQTGRVLACLHEVRDVFDDAGIPHIFLKGAGRLAAGDPGADVQFSADVDVIVPADSVERACATLRAARYAIVPNAHRRSSNDRWHHHCEAMMSRTLAVPVEIHFALAAPSLVSQRLDYAALASFARRVTSGAGDATVLDGLGSAIVLAYHARDLHVWRDIVFLSRLLRDFDAATRQRFDEYISAEKMDRLRLSSAVAAADALTCDDRERPRAARRYLAWAEVREDLPRPLYCDVVEAVVGRCPMPKLHLHPPATLVTWLRCWVRNAISVPSIAYIFCSRSRAFRRSPTNSPLKGA